MNNELRHGNFTSSEIVALTTVGKDRVSFGKPALTYIQETNMERRLGLPISDECNARPLTWGKLVEKRVFDLLGLEYIFLAQETICHPTISYWVGSPDGKKEDKGRTVTETKCPMTRKSFCLLVDPLYSGINGIEAMNIIRDTHPDGEKFYWQLVSNSILVDSKFAELIVYMPFKSELDDIRFMAQNVPTEQLSKHYWIAMGQDEDLPHLKDRGYYNNLNIIRFEVPEEDKEQLTETVIRAGKLLVLNTLQPSW